MGKQIGRSSRGWDRIRESVKEQQIARLKRTDEDQLKRLDRGGFTAKKERTKLKERIESSNKKDS